MNFNTVNNVYFIGVGGIGMSALALYFKSLGKNVYGYDKVSSKITDSLVKNGIKIHFEDAISFIPEELNQKNSLVVYTPAVPKNHKEFNYFKNNKYKIIKRAEVLGEITKNTRCLAVAGTHGKTTTSTMLGHILKESEMNATSFLGGISENYQSNLILGGSAISVVEADEFDRSFLKLSPNIACITSMDADHLDIYGEKRELEKSFKEFGAKVSETLLVRKGLPIDGLTYGLNDDSDFCATNLKIENGAYVFDVKTPKDYIKNIKIFLPGKHNVLNAVAALAMANILGVSLPAIAKALLTFKGVKRRFSYKINSEKLVLIDDYAHHPTEINAVIDAVKEMYPTKNILGIFQPHLFSRTKDFAEDFAKSLACFDELLLLDIYPARELPIEGVTSNWLLNKIRMDSKKVVEKNDLINEIKRINADVIVMIGAGNIGELVDEVKIKLLNEN